MIETDLFEFAYVPDWYGQLEQLAEMALPEAWRFRKPQTECKNTDTPILERYLHMMFRKLSIDYNTGETAYFHVENNCACFHTGLYTRQYQAIYACFERNKKKDTTLKWYFTGFCDAVSSKLRYVEPLPQKAIFPDDAKWCKLQSGMANSGKCRTHSQRSGKSGTVAKEAASVQESAIAAGNGSGTGQTKNSN